MSLEREGGVIGTLFQQIINDMKVRGSRHFQFRWHVYVQHIQLGSTIRESVVGVRDRFDGSNVKLTIQSNLCVCV